MKQYRLTEHFAAFIIVSAVLLLIYAAVQQTYRAGANDPQIQMARDIAAELEQGKPYYTHDTIDIGSSLSPFVVLFDTSEKPVQSSGYLNGRLPKLPQGVLDNAKTHGEDLVTWQPRAGVRMAMVVKSIAASPFRLIAVGRSLQEVEKREANLMKMIFLTWLGCIIVLLISGLLRWGFSSHS